MLPIITGTIRNTVRLAELDNKWQQKKKNGAQAVKKEMDAETRQILQYKEDLERMREGNQMASLEVKLKSGNALTREEIDYLKKNNPAAYRDYLEIQREKEAYEKRLKNCKTKDDVEKFKVTELGKLAAESESVANNPDIPEEKKLELIGKILGKVMNVQKVYTEFVKSGAYQELPTDEEVAAGKQAENEERREQVEEIAEAAADKRAEAEADKRVEAEAVAEEAVDKSAEAEEIAGESDKPETTEKIIIGDSAETEGKSEAAEVKAEKKSVTRKTEAEHSEASEKAAKKHKKQASGADVDFGALLQELTNYQNDLKIRTAYKSKKYYR